MNQRSSEIQPVMQFKKFFLFLVIMLVSAFSSFTTASASASEVYVTVRETKLRSKGEFLASVIANVRYGDKLSVVKDSDTWLQVSFGGKQGFIHRSAISERKVVLSSSKEFSGSNVDQNDVVLAGKGFSSEVERQFAKSNSQLNFSGVEAMERVKISSSELDAFVKQGKLVAESN